MPDTTASMTVIIIPLIFKLPFVTNISVGASKPPILETLELISSIALVCLFQHLILLLSCNGKVQSLGELVERVDSINDAVN